MSDIDQENVARTHSGALLGALAVAVVAALAGLIWSYTLSGRIAGTQTELAEARQEAKQQAADLREIRARLQVATDEISQRLGVTEKQMDARAQDLVRREAAQEATAKRLESAQQQTAQQVTAVASDVSTVKTDVGGVRTDLGKTQTDLANALSQLTSMKGDLSDHASLIARNHDELEVLKHKGDRNYYEFTLNKGEKKPVGTITLELKKADPKKSRLTLVVFSDDKSYEKKDKNVNEPLQFYAGKSPALYEIVVNTVNGKNQVSGYLSTPKGAPVPANVP